MVMDKKDQRMDGAIAVTTPNGVIARCKLLRDLEVGEQVVVDVQGSTIRKPESREQRNTQNLASCQLEFPVSAA